MPPSERPPRPKRRPGMEGSADEDSESGSHSRSSTATNSSNYLAFRDVSNGNHKLSDTSDSEEESISGRPKGLIDGLSKFFTPSDKRKSRVSHNTLEQTFLMPVLNRNSKTTSKTQQAANRLNKKYKMLHYSKRGRKPTGGPPGTSQLKGLFDGLSHLYTASQGERKRTLPLYEIPRRGVRGRGRGRGRGLHSVSLERTHISLPSVRGRGRFMGRAGCRTVIRGRGRGRGAVQTIRSPTRGRGRPRIHAGKTQCRSMGVQHADYSGQPIHKLGFPEMFFCHIPLKFCINL